MVNYKRKLKTNMRIGRKLINLLVAGALIAPAFMQTVLASTGVIYISPGSSSLQVGSSETLQLRINPGTTVDGVQATVNFSTADLQLNSVDTSGSPFSAQLQKSISGGTITLALGNLSGGVSTDSLIADMNFTALVSSGSTGLSVTNANATSSGSYTNPSASGASVSFTAPPAAPPSGGGSSGSSGSSGGTAAKHSTYYYSSSTSSTSPSAPATPSSTPQQTPTPPVHLTGNVVSVGYTSAILDVTSNQNVNFFAQYGTDAKDLSGKTATTTPSTKTTLTLGGASAPLTPGTEYYYQVIGQDSSGKQTALPVQRLMTTGFTLHVTVFNGQNQPLAHQKVSLHSRVQTTTTNGSGVATFTNVAPGVHHLEYTYNGHHYSTVLYVTNSAPQTGKGTGKVLAAVQTAAVIVPVTVSGSGQRLGAVWTALVTVLAVLIITGLVLGTTRGHILRGRHLVIKLVATDNELLRGVQEVTDEHLADKQHFKIFPHHL